LENIILSTSDNPGEGEHKLFQYIRDYPEKHAKETTVIYGLDADLVMLAMMLPFDHVYIGREADQRTFDFVNVRSELRR
jgi:5'-3' exonuclease